jgi:hypothetical protein
MATNGRALKTMLWSALAVFAGLALLMIGVGEVVPGQRVLIMLAAAMAGFAFFWLSALRLETGTELPAVLRRPFALFFRAFGVVGPLGVIVMHTLAMARK